MTKTWDWRRGRRLRFTVKLGGSILEEASVRQAILHEIASLKLEGNQIILVHGGGKSLSRRLAQLGIPSRFVDGLRVTDTETRDVALMVLAGEVNKGMVVELERLGTSAVGICGADAGAVRCVALSGDPGATQNLGLVGRPTEVNRGFFEFLLGQEIMPVVSSLALGEDFQLYNVNADHMASVCAWGTGCEALVYLTDVPGVRGRDGAVLARISRQDIEGFRNQGIISGGMLPKTSSCLEALDRGVQAVYILPGISQGILRRLLDGALEEGTFIYDNN